MSVARQAVRQPWLRLWWASSDRHRALGWLAGIGLVVAAALAVWGVPSTPFHSPLRFVGLVCPLCGMTRGVAAVMRGDLGMAWSYNPASLLLVPAAVAVLGRLLVGRLTGRWLDVSVRRTAPWVAVMAVALVALWLNQLSHADMLIAG